MEETGDNGNYFIFALQSWSGLVSALFEHAIDFDPLLALYFD